MPKTPVLIRCGGCDERWTALNACHCCACHQTFGTAGLFDLHRSQFGERGACLDPASLTTATGAPGMRLLAGLWRGPALDEETKLKRFGAVTGLEKQAA